MKLLGHISNPTSDAISKTGGKITGSYACAVLDAQNPKNTWIFRGRGPVTVKHYINEGLLLYASEERFIDKAVGVFGFKKPKEIVIEEFSGLCVNAEENTFNSFTLEKAPIGNHSWQNY